MANSDDDIGLLIVDYLTDKQFSLIDQNLQKLLDSGGEQAWHQVLSIEEISALNAFTEAVNHAVETINTASPLNRISLQQTILLGGVLTKLIPLAEYGLEQFNNHHKGNRVSAAKKGNIVAEYHCLRIAKNAWNENPKLRIGNVARRCQINIHRQFKIHKSVNTYKDWIKAAHQAGVLIIPPDAQRPGASPTP